MFNPATFTIVEEVPVLGTSEHPVMGLVTSGLRRVPGKKGMYFTVTNKGIVYTYRSQDRTFQCTDRTLEQFKAAVQGNEPWSLCPDALKEVPAGDKHIGNTLVSLIEICE